MKNFAEEYGTDQGAQLRALIDVAAGKFPLQFSTDYPGTKEEAVVLLPESGPDGEDLAASTRHAENVLIIMSDLAHGCAKMELLRYKRD